MLYIQTFQVEGRGEFPIDMLRYDACYPNTEEDAGLIAMSDHRPHQNQIRIVISRLVGAKNTPPTVGRWASFGWRIVHDSVVVRAVKL